MNLYEEESRAKALIEKKKYDEAQILLYKLSELGSIYSALTLGWLYENGVVGLINVNAAKYFYEKAALAGEQDAYWRLGSLLIEEKEFHQARENFRKGANAGHLGSMYWLGNMLCAGKGGGRDEKEGLAWLKLASSRGHLFSERRVISLESRHKSPLGKILLMPRILNITIKLIKESRKSINSDKVIR